MKKAARTRASAAPSKGPDLAHATEAARSARAVAHAPYSQYRVGAAIVTLGGRIYAGCNVENATYGATLCAERSAVSAMVAAGDRDPVACVVVTAGPKPGAPCGICRQVLAEFAEDMLLLLVAEDPSGRIVAHQRESLRELFPHAFRLRSIRGNRKKRKTNAIVAGKRSSGRRGLK